MLEFFETAKTDFLATFEGAWIFPILLTAIIWILIREKDWIRKILFGILPLAFLFLYWCPLSGLLFIRLLGDEVYWRVLWLILLAVTIPYAGCLLLKSLTGIRRQAAFLGLLAVLALGGKQVLSTEWFEASTNVYKIPQYVVDVCDLLPGNIHAVMSNRLTPYVRLYDPTITLEYARNALSFNGMEEVHGPTANLYKAVQEDEIDVDVAGPLARQQGCTFLVFSLSRTYKGDWADYGYREYGTTGEFRIFVDENYEEGQDTRKWEE